MIASGVFGLVALTLSPTCFGQTSSAPSRDRRQEATDMEIGLLKRLIKEQDRRIGELEKTVKSLQTASNPTSAAIPTNDKPTARELAKTIIKPAAPWQNPLGWTQIREGLSRAQVEEILGKPTSLESVIDHQTLLYTGDVPGSGAVTGTVKLTDDRVSEITPPNF